MLRHAARRASLVLDAAVSSRAAAPTWNTALRERFHSSVAPLVDQADRDAAFTRQAVDPAAEQDQQQPNQGDDVGVGPEDGASEQAATTESLQAVNEQHRSVTEELKAQVADSKDQVLRTLADMENLRERSARQIETNKQFAVQGFAKSLLDVADNLERAAGAVPTDAVTLDSNLSVEEVVKHLRTLLEGVQLTNKQLMTALKSNGVSKYEALGKKFDPNLHSALFELPDSSKTPGTIGVVTKSGYKLNDRVLRAAEVGVVGTSD